VLEQLQRRNYPTAEQMDAHIAVGPATQAKVTLKNDKKL
jgi:hypothetical protein